MMTTPFKKNAKSFTNNWNYPTTIRFGIGRIKELPDLCRSCEITSPLIVTDPGLVNLDIFTELRNHLHGAGLMTDVFSAIKANPNDKNVDEGVKAFHAGNHDGVVAFGGGSALDAGKAIALMVGQSRSIWDFEDFGENWKRVNVAGIVPIIAVPTTSGTGSEVGRASVITDEGKKVKKIIFHPAMLPRAVIADPGLTVGLPRHLTAATGMDALSHNLEAFLSPTFHPMAKGIALEGIRLVKEWLPVACIDGNDLVARAYMMAASTMGATAFQRGLGGMHALAHPLGAMFDAHHGTLNAILMPYVLRANRSAIDAEMQQLANYLGLKNGHRGILEWLLDLRQSISIPHDLSFLNMTENQIIEIGKMAAVDPSAQTNPLPLTAKEYSEICHCAVSGKLD